MSKQQKSVDDYIQDGIYGAKETLPDERRKYLGTIRERIEFVLYQNQVREETVYPEIKEAAKKHTNLKMFINGNMNYRFYSKYIQLADEHKLSYTVVSNKEHNAEYGLVLAHHDAVEKAEIELPKRKKEKKKKEKPSFFKRLFG
ncbi:YueI family protein [Jeotgalibacillus sp. ET6]|uniref:YueI family protein n=1 Tax=Jeotgalibacillus sp. ET6 TaxID=3037260 RepID=UPI0024186852|nr:YueI family protein [Jeotgalibacillus sp. ET6]MDG5473611.1 YueI family protein [Jeotgalibacillus sp. ET6]